MIVHSAYEPPPTCRACGDAIHDGNLCLECWRARAEINHEREREWFE